MFAKLFDTPNGQLLVTHEYDDDEHPGAPFRLVFRGEQHQGVDPSMALGWWTESERDEAFANVDQNRADETAASLSSALRSFMDTGDPA